MSVTLPWRLRCFALAAIAGGLLIAACGGDSEPPSPTATVRGGEDTETRQELNPLGIGLETSLDTTYYDVEGVTTESIFNHIERNGPTDGEGKRGSGLTTVVWGYEWQGGPEIGECVIRSMTIRAEMVVTLPRHVAPDSLPAYIRPNWDAYAESVAVHEQTHVDIYEAGAEQIRQRMLEIGAKPSCDDLEAEIKKVWAEEQEAINHQQTVFHDLEYDRLAQRRAPIEAQINANRELITSLGNQIRTYDGVVMALRKEIDSLIIDINGVDEAIKDVNASSESGQDKQAKLTVLVQQRNALQARHNSAVDEHNEALAQREPLVLQRDRLIDATNELVEQFNWTR